MPYIKGMGSAVRPSNRRDTMANKQSSYREECKAYRRANPLGETPQWLLERAFDLKDHPTKTQKERQDAYCAQGEDDDND